MQYYSSLQESPFSPRLLRESAVRSCWLRSDPAFVSEPEDVEAGFVAIMR